MIKYIGLIMILISSFSAGMYFNNKLVRRIEVLRSLKKLLQQFKIKIIYQMPNVYELFSESDNAVLKEFTNIIAEKISEGCNLKNSIETAVNSSLCLSTLHKKDKRIVKEIFLNIGVCDVDGQIQLLDNALEMIDIHLEDAVENRIKNSKVYFTAAVYAGLAIVIILF